MSEFLKMDIFFVVATLAVVAISALVAAVLFSVFRILRNVAHISDIASEEAEHVRDDVRDLHMRVRSEGLGVLPLIAFFRRFVRAASSSGSRRKRTGV